MALTPARLNLSSLDRRLDGVFPFGFAVDDVGVDAEEHGLSGAVARLFGYGKIELPPTGEREVGRVAKRDAFAEAGLEPSEEAVEASVGDDAEGHKRFAGILRVLVKIDVIAQRRIAQGQERFAGGAQGPSFGGRALDEWPVIQIVKTRVQLADAERFGKNGQEKRVRGFRDDAAAGLQETLASVGDELDGVFRVEAEGAQRFGDENVAAFGQAHSSRSLPDERDAIAKAVGFDEFGGHVGDARHFNGVDVPCAGLQCKEGKKAGTSAEIHNHIAGLHRAVNGVAVGFAANLVQQHFLVRERAAKAFEHPRLPEDIALEPAPEPAKLSCRRKAAQIECHCHCSIRRARSRSMPSSEKRCGGASKHSRLFRPGGNGARGHPLRIGRKAGGQHAVGQCVDLDFLACGDSELL